MKTEKPWSPAATRASLDIHMLGLECLSCYLHVFSEVAAQRKALFITAVGQPFRWVGEDELRPAALTGVALQRGFCEPDSK